MARYTQAEKSSARNALNYQAKILAATDEAQQRQWEAAPTPFAAWEQWKLNAPARQAAYAPWILAKNYSELCGPPGKQP